MTNNLKLLDLDSFKTKLERELSVVFDEFENNFDSNLTSALRDFVLRGGKRYRSWLIYLGYNFNQVKEISSPFLRLCVAIELVHAYLLIHDDIMDESKLRRGQPTVHEVFAKNKDLAYGTTMAILAGDLAQSLAYELISNTDFNALRVVEIINSLSSTLNSTILGQELDVGFSHLSPTEEEVIDMYRLKTASYSFELPLKIGLIASGTEYDLDSLRRFAQNTGIAFQIRDDALGLVGLPDETGKALGEDISLGKQTLLTVAMKSRMSTSQSEQFNRVFGQKKLTSKDIEIFKNLAIESGAMDHVNDLAEKYLDSALSDITEIADINELVENQLRTLVENINKRSK